VRRVPSDRTPDAPGPPPGGHRDLPTTRWTLITAAGRRGTPESRTALSDLCRLYWYPVYAFVRRRGHGAEDALDLTQGFFTRLIDKNDLADADRTRGRFRAWLLTAVKHYLANEWDKSVAQKRGGGRAVFSFDIDAGDAEDRYKLEPAHQITPERIFDRRWALTLLEETLTSLQSESAAGGRLDLFHALKPMLTSDGRDSGDPTYRDLAKRLGTTEGALKVAAHRLRRRYRELLRDLIAQTVERTEEVDDEIRDLFSALNQPA
jgi:DNA-directed RNA polymerase specialized sigma24 family protein